MDTSQPLTMQRFLIFANGEPNDGPMVQRALQQGQDAHIIAADGGARVAGYFGFTPHTLIGDMDSLSAVELAQLEAQAIDVRRYPAEKNETDLELCLSFAAQHDACWIRIIGGIGGRFDQVLANVLLMTMPQLAACDVELVAGSQTIRLLVAGQHRLYGDVGDTLSLIPLDGDARDIHTQGLQYPLSGETLHFGLARGVSNVFTTPEVEVTLASGVLLVVHTVGRAE